MWVVVVSDTLTAEDVRPQAIPVSDTARLDIDVVDRDHLSFPVESLAGVQETDRKRIDCAVFHFPFPLSNPVDAYRLGRIYGSAKRVYQYGVTPPPPHFGKLEKIDPNQKIATWFDGKIPSLLREEERRVHKKLILSSGYGLSEFGLMRSITEGDAVILKSFLGLGFSPDTINEDSIPILNLAIRLRNDETASVILDAGADPNLRSSDRGNTAVAEAAAMRSPEIMRKTLEVGGNPNEESADGQTPLMIAIGDGDAEVVEILLSAGASLDVTDKLGMTPLKYAKLFNKEKIVSLLESH